MSESSEPDVSVKLTRSGGVGGFVLQAELTSASLAPAEAGELSTLLEAAGLEKLPRRPASPPRGADRFQYDIEVRRGRNRIAVSIYEPDMTEQVKKLVAMVETVAARQRDEQSSTGA
jgi:hypothetical protein